jgi:hypothetical protein
VAEIPLHFICLRSHYVQSHPYHGQELSGSPARLRVSLRPAAVCDIGCGWRYWDRS